MGMAGAIFEPQPPNFGEIQFFEDLQIIEKPCLAKSNAIEFGKKWSSPLSMCKGVLD